MSTPPESPRATTKKAIIRLPSHSPRANVVLKSKVLQGSESPQPSGLPKIPKSSVEKVRLFRDLASTNHKQLDDRLSSKHLSSSLADIRALVETKESTPGSQSPKKNNKSPKVNTQSVQEYYAKDEVKSPFSSSPKRPVYQNPRALGKAKNGVNSKVRNNRSLASLHETRSLSPVASSAVLALKDEVRGDYGESPTSPVKISLKMQNSTYSRDFVPFALPEKEPIIKNDLYTAQHSGYAVNMGTTMKNEFKPWMSKYVKHEAPKDTLNAGKQTFFGRTSYNTEYLNFDSHRTIIEKSPRHLTTFADLAFGGGKSSYRDTFNSSPEPREFASRWFHKNDRSPFPGVSVPTQTTYSATFVPFKVGNGVA